MITENRQRVNIISTFEIPGGPKAYKHFKIFVDEMLKRLERDLGSDAVLEYAALEIKTLDTIVRD